MRLSSRQPRSLPSSLVALLLTSSLTAASPYPKDELRDLGYGYIMERSCASYCGSDNQYCCSQGQQCYTSAGIAGCAATANGGGVNFHTTTWTETKTYTSTWSTYAPGATEGAGTGVGGADCVPKSGTGQIACGPICCTNQQYCLHSGQCMPNANGGAWTTGTTVGTTVGVVTTQYSAPYRVTSGSTVYDSTGTAASQTVEPTSTDGAAVSTTDNSLSGGAIAGIVVGTIAGVILLLLLCFFCIVRGLWHSLFGGKKKDRKTERVEVIEERYSRHGSAAGRPAHRTWFGGAGGGGRPATATSRREKEKSSGAGWLATAGGAALLLLGLRRGDKKKEEKMHKPPRSNWSSSYYTDSYTASSPSKFTPH
ncbi:hypothetical protein PG994_010846 [Apiospora phragmitis]|uniref:Uncharacterized protein n=1 Tax=Apiospora phragmitis TaxID=2905665 RepID=A0ABR1TTD3_9PEZI